MEKRNQYLGQQIQRVYLMEESTNTNNIIEVGSRKHDMLYVCVTKLFDFFYSEVWVKLSDVLL